jgi:hypothetical protein
LRIPLALIFLAGLLSQADRAAVAQQVADPNVGQLAGVTLFAFGGVGFAGVRSAGEKEYDAIMSRPSRLELLEKVFEIGTPEGKSYALVGINNLNSARFKALAAELRSSKSAVRTARGCSLGRSTLGAIIQQIGAGAYSRYL